MPLAIRPLIPEDKIVDTNEIVTASVAAAWKQAGVTAALRYRNLTTEEFGTLMAYQISVGLLTYGRQADYTLATGQLDAQQLLDLAKTLGIPPGLTYGLDLETPSGATIADLLTYEKGFSGHIYTIPTNLAGVYCGAGLMMTSVELTSMGAKRYYKSGSRVCDAHNNPSEPARGWSLIQRLPFDRMLGGARVDYDSAGSDYYGDAWTVVRATPSTTTFSFPVPESAVKKTDPPPPPTERNS